MRRLILLFCIISPGYAASAQTISIKKIELAGEKVIVHYDLDDGNPNNEYKLDLYGSRDNFTAPLTKVKGDVGPEIKPGTNRKIEWSIREEYGAYKGKVALEIKGKVYVPFVKLQNFNTSKAYKRGTSHNLGWKPGNNNPINIELFKGGQRISGEMNQPNNGSHTLYIPSKAKPGKDYRLKISDVRNPEDVLYSDNFTVKPKLPVIVKVLPVLVVAGIAAAIGSGGGGDSGGNTGSMSDLPEAPTTPSGN
jgi:hypothetical protein